MTTGPLGLPQSVRSTEDTIRLPTWEFAPAVFELMRCAAALLSADRREQLRVAPPDLGANCPGWVGGWVGVCPPRAEAGEAFPFPSLG